MAQYSWTPAHSAQHGAVAWQHSCCTDLHPEALSVHDAVYAAAVAQPHQHAEGRTGRRSALERHPGQPHIQHILLIVVLLLVHLLTTTICACAKLIMARVCARGLGCERGRRHYRLKLLPERPLVAIALLLPLLLC